MKIPVLLDDYYHPGEVIEYGLNKLSDTHDFEYYYDGSTFDFSTLSDYRLIILTKSNVIDRNHKEPFMGQPEVDALLKFVRNGGALLALHAGTTSFENYPEIKALIGGRFDHHPDPLPVHCVPQKGHFMTEGIPEYVFTDEHYHLNMTDDVDIFMTTVSDHGEQPGGWIRHEGQGRVCVLTPGHYKEVFDEPSYQLQIRKCIAWCLDE